MKKLHLLCNAHIDPAWLWRRNEGLAETISTFRVAADFCENYDGFIFNHNEAVLYEWVEEHEPALFERIKKLVKAGKWKIIGGWYLQPDCVMTSGESLMEQIALGREYFEEKFGVTPTTALNFDSFGHTRGLVQILKNAGYDSYLFMRPKDKFEGDFIWEGYDGSRILAHGIHGWYNALKGNVLNKVKEYIDEVDSETGLRLWGVGNHGGGPSKIDLENINAYIKESNIEILHSFPEAYMADVDRSKLNVVSESLIPCMAGCYTSMVRIKQANRRLENNIAVTEKLMSYAALLTDYEFDADELKKAKKALAFCQFHDILPGSAIKPVEEDSLRNLNYGEEIIDTLYNKAFFKLCDGQKKAKDGEIPILIFNPHPYEIEGEFEVGFMLQNQNYNEDELTVGSVYDKYGNTLPTQNEKPECTFELDWPKKICFRGKLEPSSVNRFDCRLNVVKKSSLTQIEYGDDFIEIKNDRMTASISKKTGLISSYILEGKSYIKSGGQLEVYKDNEDPWGMTVDSFKNFEGTFKLMSDEATNDFAGYPEEKISNVRIIEDGDVRVKVQAFFEYKHSIAVVEYTIPKQGTYIDTEILMYSADANKMIKYKFDTELNGVPYGETAFGVEALYSDETEAVYHKWCGIKDNDNALYVINKGTYGGSFTGSTMKLSLLRTPIYAAHPIENKDVIAPHNRFTKHIDMGERRFFFRITAENDIAKQAQIYNEEPRLISFFPSGDGEKKESVIKIDNRDVILSSFKNKDGKYELNIYNSAEKENDTEIRILGKNITLHFNPYELKSIVI